MSSSTLAAGIRQLRHRLAAQCEGAESDEQLLAAFLHHRDESAFAALVRRHGPMVLHVCRRVLGHEQDAEDAFQATFLVFAQQAASLRKRTALASFLHGIAFRTALRAKKSAARRRKHEGRTPTRSPIDPSDELSWREVRALLDEEIACLPEIYRSAFVLCCLQSIPGAEAARRLGVKEGTLSSRLTAARKRLAQRLARRGVELSALLAAVTVGASTSSALRIGLVASTTKTALALSLGSATAPAIPAAIAELMPRMTLDKAKIAAAVLLVLATSGSLVSWYRQASGPLATTPELPAAKAAEQSKTRTPPRERSKSVEVAGRVLDPVGKPVRGAKLLFLYGSGKAYPQKVWATSAADGRFDFTVPVKDVDNGYSETPWKYTCVVAAAEGYGFAAARLGKPGADDLTLRLVKDDGIIRGRILDLQGQPVAGVRVRVADRLSKPEKGDLTAFLAALKTHKDNPGNAEADHLMWLYSPALDLLFPSVTTDVDGRFRLRGIGRERMAHLRIEGATIATTEIQVLTRPSETIRLPVQKEFPKGQNITYYGDTFDLLVPPSRPVLGVVRDKDTGKPLAGVTVETSNASRSDFIRTTTDKNGRYRLDGLPKGDGNEIVATIRYWLTDGPADDGNAIAAATNELPYLTAIEKVGNPPGLDPVTVNFALTRGVWVKGRVTDKATGKPLWAGIQYFCFGDNPRANEIARLGTANWRSSNEDGVFRIPVLPGHGLIAVRAYHDHYIMGIGADKIKGPRAQGLTNAFRTTPYLCFGGNFHTLIEIDSKAGEESITCNVTLDPGRTLTGTVLGPDGKPLAGARVSGLKNMEFWSNDPLPGADFTVESLQPNKSRLLQFRHDGKKLSGWLLVRGDAKGPLRVRLQRWGTLTGRIVTPDGVPLASVRVNCWMQVKRDGSTVSEFFGHVHPDKDGRFRIEGLAAGAKYTLGVGRSNVALDLVGGEPKNLMIEPGETKDVGEIRVKPQN